MKDRNPKRQTAICQRKINKKMTMMRKKTGEKKVFLPSEMDINVVHLYSYLREKLLCLTYDATGVKLTVTLQVCDSSARSKAKSRAVRNKTNTRA